MQVVASSSSRKVGKLVTNFPVTGKALKRELRRVWSKGEDEIQQFGPRAYGILSIS
jgi:hypothetical protein